ncbi:MAG TPA: diguanylate cyclase [Noviherbaspirillum sp.]
MPLPDLLVNAILYFFIPLWVLAGFGDWVFHRITHISETSGLRESLLHQLMLAELGIPMLAGLFLEINALILGCMILGFLLHEATVFLDLRYTADKRQVLPGEQLVHSFQELLPLTMLSLVVFLHWDQLVALVTMNGNADLALEWKRHPLPPAYLTALILGTGALVVLPFLEELWRCYRHAPRSR